MNYRLQYLYIKDYEYGTLKDLLMYNTKLNIKSSTKLKVFPCRIALKSVQYLRHYGEAYKHSQSKVYNIVPFNKF